MSPARPSERRARSTRSAASVEAGPDPAELVTLDDYDCGDQPAEQTRRDLQRTATRLLAEHARTPPRHRLERLVFTRESDEHDRLLLAGSLARSCARNADAPRVEEVLAAGVAPLYDQDFEQDHWKVEQTEKPRAVFFILGDVGWIISAASAGATSADGTNAITQYLVEKIETYQPRILDAYSFARLVRSAEHGPNLGQACARYVDVVRAGEYSLNFAGSRGMATFLWGLFSMLSDEEHEELLRQKLTGALVKYKRGGWVNAAKQAPPVGYPCIDGRLRRDDSQRQVVEDMLRILVSEQTDTMKIEQLVGCGAVRSRPQLAGVNAKLRGLSTWIPLYVTGTWWQRWANPVRGLTEWLGLPVIRPEGDDLGFFRLEYDLGLPPGGWAPRPLLRAALDLHRRVQQRRRGLRRGAAAPLVGYTQEGHCGPRRETLQGRLCAAGGDYDLRVRSRPNPKGPA